MSDLHPSPSAEAGPPKTLRWFDGFMLAVPIANGLFISVGYAIGAIGALPAVAACAPLSVVWPRTAAERVGEGLRRASRRHAAHRAVRRSETGRVGEHEFDVVLARSGDVVRVPTDQSVLTALRHRGVDL